MMERLQLNIRLDGQADLLEALKEKAKSQGSSVNQFVVDALKLALGWIARPTIVEASLADEKLTSLINAMLDEKLTKINERLDYIDKLLDTSLDNQSETLDNPLDRQLDNQSETLDNPLDAQLDNQSETLDNPLDAQLDSQLDSQSETLDNSLDTPLDIQLEGQQKILDNSLDTRLDSQRDKDHLWVICKVDILDRDRFSCWAGGNLGFTSDLSKARTYQHKTLDRIINKIANSKYALDTSKESIGCKTLWQLKQMVAAFETVS